MAWYQSKVKFQRTDVEGVKTVVEQYLIDAESYTEAEVRVNEICGGENFLLDTLKKVKLSEVFHTIKDGFGAVFKYGGEIIEESEAWWKAKVAFMEYNEKTGKDKKVVHDMLVFAESFIEAYDQLNSYLKNSDCEVIGLEETQIIGVFPYTPQDEEEQANF